MNGSRPQWTTPPSEAALVRHGRMHAHRVDVRTLTCECGLTAEEAAEEGDPRVVARAIARRRQLASAIKRVQLRQCCLCGRRTSRAISPVGTHKHVCAQCARNLPVELISGVDD